MDAYAISKLSRMFYTVLQLATTNHASHLATTTDSGTALLILNPANESPKGGHSPGTLNKSPQKLSYSDRLQFAADTKHTVVNYTTL